MPNGIGYHQCQQQHDCQGESEAIEVIVDFTFCNIATLVFGSLTSFAFGYRFYTSLLMKTRNIIVKRIRFIVSSRNKSGNARFAFMSVLLR